MKPCSSCLYLTEEGRCGHKSVLLSKEPNGWRSYPNLQRADEWTISTLLGTCGKRGRWYSQLPFERETEIEESTLYTTVDINWVNNTFGAVLFWVPLWILFRFGPVNILGISIYSVVLFRATYQSREIFVLVLCVGVALLILGALFGFKYGISDLENDRVKAAKGEDVK